MEENNQQPPKEEKETERMDSPMRELNKSINSLIWITRLAIFYFKWMRKAIKVTENLIIASWFGLIFMGIWTGDTIYYRVAFGILVAGAILFYIAKALVELFKKPKNPAEKPKANPEIMNMIMASVVMDKLKTDENYRNEVVKKFFDKMMEKKNTSGQTEEKSESEK